MNCGPKFVKLCMPSIITFGKKEGEIKSLTEQVQLLDKQLKEFQEMEKAKKNLKRLQEQANRTIQMKEVSL